MSEDSNDPYNDPVRMAKVTTVYNTLLDSTSDQLMVMLKTIIRMQMDEGYPCSDGCQNRFTVGSYRRESDITHQFSLQNCISLFDDDRVLRAIEDVIQKVERNFQDEDISICPECLVPTVPRELIHPTSDIYGHGPEPDPPCTTSCVDLFGPSIRLLEDPIVRAAVGFTTEDFTYGGEMAGFLSQNDLDRLPNIYMLFLLHHFTQPSISFTPLSSDDLMASAVSPYSKPRPEIGPRRIENIKFIQQVSLAYHTAVAIEVQKNNITLPVSGGSTAYESFLDGSSIEAVTKYERKA